MKVTELSPAAQEFLQEIRGQMSADVILLFDATLANLGKPSAATQTRLDKLSALEDAGVDNWEGYDEAMAELEGDKDD